MTNVWVEIINRGFKATYFVAPETINQSGPTLSSLVLLKQSGIEIAPYTNVDMVAMYLANRDVAFSKLKSLSDGMASFGFTSETLAPNERKWNTQLANMARGRYKGVRVAKTGAAVQAYPIIDPLYVNDGAFASLGSATPLQSVKDAITATVTAGGMLPLVMHHIGTPVDGLTFAPSDFIAVLDFLVSLGSSVRVPRFVDALTAP